MSNTAWIFFVMAIAPAGCAIPPATPPELLSKEVVDQNYWHLRFRAAESSDIARPSEPGEIVDFYGPCDETPTSRNQILALRRFRQFRFGREYMDK